MKLSNISYIICGNNYEFNNVIGKITSGTHSPTLKSSIAIGLLKRDFNIVNNKVRIKVRDKFLEAEIRKLPMYRRRRKWVKFLNH